MGRITKCWSSFGVSEELRTEEQCDGRNTDHTCLMAEVTESLTQVTDLNMIVDTTYRPSLEFMLSCEARVSGVVLCVR